MQNDHKELAIYGVEKAPAERTLVEVFQSTVKRYPTVNGLEGVDGTLTYQELAQRVDEVAIRLNVHGIGAGHYVGVRVPSGTTDLYVAILGVLHSGAAYVPVDWDESPERAATVFRESKATAIIGENLVIRRPDDAEFAQGDEPAPATLTTSEPTQATPPNPTPPNSSLTTPSP